MKDFSYITNSSPAYIESLYNEFLTNPENVDPDLKKFFEGFDFALSNAGVNGKEIKSDKTVSVQEKQTTSSTPADFNLMAEINVYRMILGIETRAIYFPKPIQYVSEKTGVQILTYHFLDLAILILKKSFMPANL